MARRRRDNEQFNLSFLDVIACGFGAIILLLIISRIYQPTAIEQTADNLEQLIAALQRELFETRGETDQLDRLLKDRQVQLSSEKDRLAQLRAELTSIRGQFVAITSQATVRQDQQAQLVQAKQSLTDEMERLLGANYKRFDETIGGIPVDSEYIIFIIDTSGSMFNYSWNLVIEKLTETLDVYPQVKGLQIMNDMGNYMFSQTRGKWIPDTPARRKAIIQRLRNWNSFSNSSPVEGITKAISTYYSENKKISLYVFGDEFTGPSIENVVETVDRLNRKDSAGNRRVRIHGIGFPVLFAVDPSQRITGIRFASLMRILCERNGGTFVALNSFR